MFNNVTEIEIASDKLYNYCPQRNLNPGGEKYPWRFTGWKYDGYNFMTDDPPRLDGAFVAQWIYYVKPLGIGYYVNLPGMQSGYLRSGGLLEIGAERVHAATSKEEIIRLVTEGKEKLLALLKEANIEPAPIQ